MIKAQCNLINEYFSAHLRYLGGVLMGLFQSTIHNFPEHKKIGREVSSYDLYKNLDEVLSRSWPDQYNMDLSSFTFPLNIQESKEGYHVEAELPGVHKENIEISIKSDDLIIRGEKMCVNPERKNQYHRIERPEGHFYRAVTLPKDIDKEKINAELKEGVLRIDIMKTNNVQHAEKKISIR